MNDFTYLLAKKLNQLRNKIKSLKKENKILKLQAKKVMLESMLDEETDGKTLHSKDEIKVF